MPLPEGRLPHLDGLRFLAFLGVITVHQLPQRGWFLGFGLHLFWVLSGFLIARQLSEAEGMPSLLLIGRFFIRRALRIWPAYFATLLVAGILGASGFFGYHAAFLFNFKLYALSRHGSFASHFPDWRLANVHLWTVSIEEQFYLFSPALFVLVGRKKRPAAALMLLILSMAFGAWRAHANSAELYGTLPFVSGGFFLWGSLAYFVYQSHPDLFRRWWLGPAVLVGMIGWFLIAAPAIPRQALVHLRPTPWHHLFALASALTVGSLCQGSWPTAQRILSWGPFSYLGKRSFALYLFHPYAWLYAQRILPPESQLAQLRVGLLALLLTFLTGILSWYFVEEPINRLKVRLALRPAVPEARSANRKSGWIAIAPLLLLLVLPGCARKAEATTLSSSAKKATVSTDAPKHHTRCCWCVLADGENFLTPFLDKKSCEDRTHSGAYHSCKLLIVDDEKCALVEMRYDAGALRCRPHPTAFWENGKKQILQPPLNCGLIGWQIKAADGNAGQAEDGSQPAAQGGESASSNNPPEDYCSCGQDPNDPDSCLGVRMQSGKNVLAQSVKRKPGQLSCTREVCFDLFPAENYKDQCRTYVDGNP